MNEGLNGAILLIVILALCLSIGGTQYVKSPDQTGTTGHPLLSD